MTHVLNFALRKILLASTTDEPSSVTTIDQKGSFQDEYKSRFDFSWNGPITTQQLAQIEQLCVERIEKQVPVESYVAPLAAAEQINSLRAVFGEKYPDPVRVVAVSNHPIPEMLANPQDATWNEYAVEFCGGTHLTNTKEAEAFALLSEEGIAKGIRRIVFVTKDDAKKALGAAQDFESKLEQARAMTMDNTGGDDNNNNNVELLESQVKSLAQEITELTLPAVKKVEFRDAIADLTKQVMAYKKQKIANMADEAVAQMVKLAESMTDANKIVFRFDFGTDGKVFKSLTTTYGKKVKDKALLLVSADTDADKLLVGAFAPKGMKDSIDCKAWVAAATEGMDAKGGGKKDMAQFQVVGVSNADAVMAKAKM
jgi:alanyl-tRNA synthetase